MSDDDIERRLEQLSGMVDSLAKRDVERSQIEVYDEAALRTHRFLLFHICAKLGVPFETFEEHYSAVFNRHLAAVLNEARQVSPVSASLLDTRFLDDFDSCDPIPRLFPDGPI